MHCLMCYCRNESLQKLEKEMASDLFEQISFILPALAIPDTKDDIYGCATCLEQVATFCEIKQTVLENIDRLNFHKDRLKGTNDVKVNELKIIVNDNEVSTINRLEIEFIKVETNYDDLLLSEDNIQFTEKDTNATSKKRRAPRPRRYKCNFCQKAFTSPSSLAGHTRIHTGERPYKCSTCQKSFIDISNLNAHQNTHTLLKQHECDVCHKTFRLKTTLKRHKRIHSDLRPYQCSLCNMAFKWSGDVIRHMRKHTGEKPYQCQMCQYKSTDSSALKKHIRLHTGEKGYTCNVCHTTFALLSKLKDHKLTLHNA